MTYQNRQAGAGICRLLLLLALLTHFRAAAQEHPDRVVQSGVPQGKVTAGQFP